MTGPRYTPLVESLPANVPFVGPEEQERARGAPFAARLGANESLFGPSPKALAAIRAEAEEIWKYGDPTSHDLRAALADHMGVAVENVLVGEGIDGLLGNLVRLLVAPGDAVVTSDGAYPTFNYHVAGFGGGLHKVPYRDDHEDLGALIARAREVDARLIYYANPDNPMGTWARGADVLTALDDLPPGCLLCLDEAYVEFAPEGTAAEVPANDPRVIRMRTFSKAYGMAGARIGYAVGAADLIKSFDKIRNHFGMNRMAQAGALAALHDATGWRMCRPRWPARATRLRASPTKTGCAPSPRPPISSPSIVATTAISRAPCCRVWWRGACSCACPSWPRRIAASASAAAAPTIWPC